MFTGIVEETGVVKKIAKSKQFARITIEAKNVLKNVVPGESISVDGACLTVVQYSRPIRNKPRGGSMFSADLSDETLKRTTLGSLHPGSPVNLERAARFSDRIGGHLVSGHIDGIGAIKKIEPVENACLFFIELPKKLLKYCIEKGSIAIDGVSLTVNQINPRGIFLMIIPHTLKVTTLGHKKEGDKVNIENDLVGKYVERFVKFR
ncbi:MAG: riboflavin synthase [Nitrospirae bacterium]|nr:riboflavin synthase [Nitrospirota bacterium]MBI3351632.1 riboflavin synthase [Nitrospirota bacterium]